MKALVAAVAAVVLAPVALVVVVLGGGSRSASALGPVSCVVGTGAAGTPGVAAGPGAQVAGTVLDAGQVAVIRTSLGVVKGRGLSQHVGVIVLAGERQESSWHNLDHGDRDSVGVLQQRPSQDWGSPAQLQDPAYAVGKFLDRVVQVPRYLTDPAATVIQAVQISADGSLYARWVPLATAIVAAFWSGSPGVECTGGGSGVVPSAQAAAALERAKSMLGKPYCWVGGTATGASHGTGGPGCEGDTAGFDCSGLMLYAWAPFVSLPHYTGDQVKLGRRVPLAQAQPGDLVFLANAASGIHHVAMIASATGDAAGDGQIIEAQDFNVAVHIRAFRGVNEPEIMPFAVRLAS